MGVDMWKSRLVTVSEGITLYAEEMPSANAPIVMLHGITNTGRIWQRLARTLANNYHIITCDARGHGQSSKPRTGYDPHTLMTDVYALLNMYSLERVILIGHSMGAHTAALLAAKYPERIETVILEDPPWMYEQQSAEKRESSVRQWKALLTRWQQTPIPDLIAQRQRHSPQWSDDEYHIWARAKHAVSLDALSFMGHALDWRSLISRWTMPVLLCTGDPQQGAMLDPQVTDWITHHQPHIQIESFSGVGHNISRDAFTRFSKTLKGFLYL